MNDDPSSTMKMATMPMEKWKSKWQWMYHVSVHKKQKFGIINICTFFCIN
jgi:hypothetical protein